MFLDWTKCAGDAWCALDDVDLTKIEANGVFVIWKPRRYILQPSTVVRVGSGRIGDQLAMHKLDDRITRHGPGLLVTWATVDAPSVAVAVEAYLARLLRPLEGEWLLSGVAPVSVNLPASA